MLRDKLKVFVSRWEPQVGRGLFSIRLLILHIKFQFSKSIKSSTFHTILWEKYLFPKMAKNHPKIYTNRQPVVNELSREIWRCLKRDRDIGRKAALSEVIGLHVN